MTLNDLLKEHKTAVNELDTLSDSDKKYLENGGVIIRCKDELQIECITRLVPYWHIHVATTNFENSVTRDAFYKRMLEFADYKEFKQ